ncbi:syntaxin-17-like protein [Dermatophagoides farinae]|uniref:Syntaxin-17-like protein n=1 Tax=Dermatophagoides farinae TaxID=6954 RepID=A0A9D4NYU4_DERFA|nr:syntaxin-17-like protein [Dermatophagoides farinae]
MNVQQKRKILLYKDSIDKIITNGIQPNLVKLEKSAKIIRSNPAKKLLTKECMSSHLITQQLRNNLNELEKCYKLLNELTTDNEYDHKVQSIRKEQQQQQQIQQTNLVEENIRKASRTLRDVQALNQDLEDLHDMMSKFGTIVHEQQTPVDHIEQNIENTTENVREGTKSLAIAASSSVVPIACAAVGATIFGPIGALISFKLSTGIASAIGGSVASYSLASYVKKRNRRHAELELLSITDGTTNRTIDDDDDDEQQ